MLISLIETAGFSPLRLTLVVMKGFLIFLILSQKSLLGILMPRVFVSETQFKKFTFFFFSISVYGPGK